jgi:hypothetical protein
MALLFTVTARAQPSGFFFSPAVPVEQGNRPAQAPTTRPAPTNYGVSSVRDPYGAYRGAAAGQDLYGGEVGQNDATLRLPLNLFSIVGIPNKSGEIIWPLGFRLLPQSQNPKRLLLQTNAQFLAVMGQRAVQGKADPVVQRALNQSLRQLRLVLVQNDAMLGHGIFVESRDFLDRLDQVAALLRDGP